MTHYKSQVSHLTLIGRRTFLMLTRILQRGRQVNETFVCGPKTILKQSIVIKQF